MGIESYHIPPGLQPECWTLPRLQWESSSPLDSGENTRGRVKYSQIPPIKSTTYPAAHPWLARTQSLKVNSFTTLLHYRMHTPCSTAVCCPSAWTSTCLLPSPPHTTQQQSHMSSKIPVRWIPGIIEPSHTLIVTLDSPSNAGDPCCFCQGEWNADARPWFQCIWSPWWLGPPHH